MTPLAEYSTLVTSEYHLIQIYDVESEMVDPEALPGELKKSSQDGVMSIHDNRMLEMIQAEETFKVKIDFRVWGRTPLAGGPRGGHSFSFRLSVPSKVLVLNSVAKGAQELWELPEGGDFNGRICHVGRETARSLAERLWDEIDEDYSFEEEQQMARPHDGTENYIIDLWPA